MNAETSSVFPWKTRYLFNLKLKAQKKRTLHTNIHTRFNKNDLIKYASTVFLKMKMNERGIMYLYK